MNSSQCRVAGLIHCSLVTDYFAVVRFFWTLAARCVSGAGMNFIDRIKTAYRINTRIWNAVIVFFFSAIFLNFPWLLAWLPKSAQEDIFLVADQALKYGVLFVLLWVKDSRVSGNGTAEKPYRMSGKGGR